MEGNTGTTLARTAKKFDNALEPFQIRFIDSSLRLSRSNQLAKYASLSSITYSMLVPSIRLPCSQILNITNDWKGKQKRPKNGLRTCKKLSVKASVSSR